MLMPADTRARYWQAGGSIVGFGGVYLTPDRARDLQDFYIGLACREPPDVAAWCSAFARDLGRAIIEAKAWMRAAAGRP